MKIRMLALAFGALIVLSACGSKDTKSEPLTQRQRDSIIGASRLPGAQGVKGALASQDSAARRKAILDSIARADSL